MATEAECNSAEVEDVRLYEETYVLQKLTPGRKRFAVWRLRELGV